MYLNNHDTSLNPKKSRIALKTYKNAKITKTAVLHLPKVHLNFNLKTFNK